MLRIIAGKFKNQPLKTPKSKSTRPTQNMVREAVFNICQSYIEGARFLDLFAGSGSMGFEALSRGALHVSFVEKGKEQAFCIKENAEKLQVTSQITLLSMAEQKAIEKLAKAGASFDIIYIDPPYDLPFDLETIAQIASKDSTIFLEERHDPKKNYFTANSSPL